MAVVAETNEHVDVLNGAIQQARQEAGHLGAVSARVAGGERAALRDHVVTRRNDRSLRTDRGEPVRNRDRWIVTSVGPDGTLTVSHLNGHGTARLPVDYARSHVRLGYAATAHGHQGDTVDVGLAVVFETTTHRSLYVGATRGRNENRLFVVTDEPDHARDVLERVLTNDRADVPAIAQRRNLADHAPLTRRVEDTVSRARRILADTDPFLRAVRHAEAETHAAEARLRMQRAVLAETPRWRRRPVAQAVEEAERDVAAGRERLDRARAGAGPHLERIQDLECELRAAEREAKLGRLVDRFEQLQEAPPARSLDRGVGIDGPGL